MTFEQTLILTIQKIFEQWNHLGRKGLFCTFLEKQEKGILELLDELPQVRKKLPHKLLKELEKKPLPKPLSDTILALYMPQITLIYQEKRVRGTFEQFLDQFRDKFPTIELLETYLKEYSSKQP